MTTLTTRATKGSILSFPEADANFKRLAQTKAGNYTVLVSDNRDVIEVTATATITLPDALAIATAADTGDFEVTIKNISGVDITIECTTGTDTIEGSTSDWTLSDDDCITLKANQNSDGYNIINGDSVVTNPVLNGSVTGTGVLDEDDMSSDSATALATQQSIKAYIDNLSLTLSTVQTPTGTTQVNFSSIPSGVKRITVSVHNMTITTGVDGLFLRIGTGGTPKTSGYNQALAFHTSGSVTAASTLFNCIGAIPSSSTVSGQATLALLDSVNNIWSYQSNFVNTGSTDYMATATGSVALSGALDIVRLSTVSNITGGSFSILYEK